MQEFDLSDILSITTGRLVSTRHIGGVYAILNYMTGSDLYTNQLPYAMNLCQPHLRALYPQLAEVSQSAALAALDTALSVASTTDEMAEIVAEWVEPLRGLYGHTLPVPQLAGLAETFANPMADLLQMHPRAEILLVDDTEREETGL
jgi:hypothetical protein